MAEVIKKENLGESWSFRPNKDLEEKMTEFMNKNSCGKADVIRTAVVKYFKKK